MAGLGVAYYARKSGLPFTLYDAAPFIGGNCITFRQGDFLFDSGAHRLHDRDAEVTREIRTQLKGKLIRVSAPSQIYHKGKMINFPLSPFDLSKNIGPGATLRGVLDILRIKLNGNAHKVNFRDFALARYGKEIATTFLLNYSEKLWGLSAEMLSPEIAGKRLQGLDLRTFIIEPFLGKKAKANHLEGHSFFYPRGGIGAIPKAIARYCGNECFHLGFHISRVISENGRITALGINGCGTIDTRAHHVVSTLPLSQFVQMMEPSPPSDVLENARSLRFRNLVLAALFLKRDRITSNATIYFPESHFGFTRLYEPRNREISMSPPGKTSLIAEFPCQGDDEIWGMDDELIIRTLTSYLRDLGWINRSDVIGCAVKRLKDAYPILEVGYQDKVENIGDYLRRFSNLTSCGRNGGFEYSWIHDMMLTGERVVKKCIAGA